MLGPQHHSGAGGWGVGWGGGSARLKQRVCVCVSILSRFIYSDLSTLKACALYRRCILNMLHF